LVAQGLNSPRSILFDSNGGLLVVQQGYGVVHLAFTDNGGTCLEVAKKTYLINSTAVSLPLIRCAEVGLLICIVESWYCPLE
jgi:hypothetical protein